MPKSLAERVALVPAVHTAFYIAKQAHEGQVDKAGEPYIGHVIRVAEYIAATGAPDEAVVVALLHDVVEDTDVSLSDLRHYFIDAVVTGVDAMTHRPHEPRGDYLARVNSHPIALLVKAEGDLRDNTDPRRPSTGDPEGDARRRRKYADAVVALKACAYLDSPEHNHDDCVDGLVAEVEEYLRVQR